MLSQLFAHLAIMAIFILCAWFLIKHPAGRQLSLNARCERDYYLLINKIMACKNVRELTELESQVEDYYVEFGDKALNAKEYRDHLFNLITQIQYV